MSTDSAGISTRNLTKFYGTTLGVENITFDVRPGEVMGFLGPNGSGKTTVMRMLMGLIHITKGSASIMGLDVSARDGRARRSVGYIPGVLGLYPNLTVEQYVQFLARIRGVDCVRQAIQLAERLSLDPGLRIGGLSKGTKQKVGVVQAFMHQPDVLILDEPTAGLDPIVQREFEAMMIEARDRGACVLLSSHVMHEVEQLANRVAIINKGKLLVVDDIATLKTRTSRRLIFEFPSAVYEDPFEGVAGVVDSTATDRYVECVIVGPETAALHKAVSLGVLTVTSHEPSLEDIFFHETANSRAE